MSNDGINRWTCYDCGVHPLVSREWVEKWDAEFLKGFESPDNIIKQMLIELGIEVTDAKTEEE